MTLTAQAAHDKERQQLFEKIRHLVASKYKVPEYLSYGDLCIIEELLTDGTLKSDD